MINSLLKQVGESEDKSYRQVKIIQGSGSEKIQFVADIRDEENEIEKIEELFQAVFQQMQKIKFYEENK